MAKGIVCRVRVDLAPGPAAHDHEIEAIASRIRADLQQAGWDVGETTSEDEGEYEWEVSEDGAAGQ